MSEIKVGSGHRVRRDIMSPNGPEAVCSVLEWEWAKRTFGFRPLLCAENIIRHVPKNLCNIIRGATPKIAMIKIYE